MSLDCGIGARWSIAKRLLSRSQTANVLFGSVVFETEREVGGFGQSFFELKVKKTIDGNRFHISAVTKADASVVSDGIVTNYINFDIKAAMRLREKLDQCIEFALKQNEL